MSELKESYEKMVENSLASYEGKYIVDDINAFKKEIVDCFIEYEKKERQADRGGLDGVPRSLFIERTEKIKQIKKKHLTEIK